MTGRAPRRGFALVTVLWVVGLAGSVALTAVLDGRLAVDAARQRIADTRGGWLARGCLAHARAATAVALAEASGEQGSEFAWRAIDDAIAGLLERRLAACTLVVEALGARVDVNAVEAAALTALITTADPAADAPALVDALLDWRDADGAARPMGAEAPWYAGAARLGPPNAPLRAREELRAVRGFERAETILALLDIERARVALLHAPRAVLLTLPGFDAEAVAFVEERRQRVAPVRDLHALVAEAPVRVRSRLQQDFAALSERATLTPDGWVVAAAVDDATTGRRAIVEQLLRRSGAQVVVARERTW